MRPALVSESKVFDEASPWNEEEDLLDDQKDILEQLDRSKEQKAAMEKRYGPELAA